MEHTLFFHILIIMSQKEKHGVKIQSKNQNITKQKKKNKQKPLIPFARVIFNNVSSNKISLEVSDVISHLSLDAWRGGVEQ